MQKSTGKSMQEREPVAARGSAGRRPTLMFLVWLYAASGALGLDAVLFLAKPKPSYEELVVSRLLIPGLNGYSQLYLLQPENKKILQLVLEGCSLRVGFRFEQCHTAWQTVSEEDDDWKAEAGLIRI